MDWDIYPLEKDGQTTWFAWRLAAYSYAPDRTRVTRLDVTHAVRHPDAAGLPTEAELEALVAVRDAIEQDIEKAVDGKYVVRTTGAGRVVHTFYAPNHQGFFRRKKSLDVATAAAAELAQEFPDYPLTVTATQDEEWEAFFTAFPSEDGAQWFADARQVIALANSGVPVDAPRALVHRLALPTEAAREKLAAAAAADGFVATARFPFDEEPDLPAGLELEREVATLAIARVHAAVLDLIQLAHGENGQYLGWGLPGAVAGAAAAGDGPAELDGDDDADDDEAGDDA